MESDYYNKCTYCESTKLYNLEGEVCCAGCGAVIGDDYQPEQVQSEAKINLYQATEVGTKKVNLDCARHMHETNPEISALSNVCVKIELPIYAAQDAKAIYQKITRQKRKEKLEFAMNLKNLADKAILGLAEEDEFSSLKRSRPKGCTKAHTAVFAVHLVCRKYGLPRSDDEILGAVRMNFGVKRTFTVLKSYSLNEITAQDLGIGCSYDKAAYYVRLRLSKIQDVLDTGQLYDKIMRHAISNLQNISDMREDARASRAVELALRGVRLHVPI